MTAPPAGALEACLALLENAVPGPMVAVDETKDIGRGMLMRYSVVRGGDGENIVRLGYTDPNVHAFAAAVNYLRQHGPALLAALRLREGCQRLEQRWRDRENFDCYVRSDEQFSGVLRGRGICADDLARVLEEGE